MKKVLYVRTIYNEVDCANYVPLSTFLANLFENFAYGNSRCFESMLNYLNFALLNNLYIIRDEKE